MNIQSKSGSSYKLAARPRVVMRGSSRRSEPASSTRTFIFGSSESLVATTSPEVYWEPKISALPFEDDCEIEVYAAVI